MKTFTTNKILVEVTTEDLENLNVLLNQVQLYHYDKLETKIDEKAQRYFKKCMETASRLWREVYEIQKELPF